MSGNSNPDDNHNIACVLQGDLLLRDSMYMTEEPEALKLAGVYVAATGHLHARMQPVAGPISVSIEDNATQPRETPEYRCTTGLAVIYNNLVFQKASLWKVCARPG